jgi:hypothetical protein
MTENITPDRMERFERKVVFRTARGYFFLLAVLAVLAFVGGIALGAKGLIKVPVEAPADPTLPPPPPDPPSLTKQALETWASGRAARQAAAQANSNTLYHERDDAPGSAPVGSAQAEERARQLAEIAKLSDAMAGLFPPPTYTWADTYETVCVNSVPGYPCLQSERRLTKPGTVHLVSDFLEGKDRETTLKALRLWTTFLPLFPVEARAAWVKDLLEAVSELDADHRHTVEAWASDVARLNAGHAAKMQAFRDEVAAQEQRRQREQMWGLYGIGGGLVLLVLVSIFLVHFAIERHLRLMREVAGLLQKTTLGS